MGVDLFSLIYIRSFRETSWRMQRGSCNEIIRAACDCSTVSLYEINFHVISLSIRKKSYVIHVLFFNSRGRCEKLRQTDVSKTARQSIRIDRTRRIFRIPRKWWAYYPLLVFESAVYMAQVIRLKYHIRRVMWRIQTHPLHLQQDTRLHPSAAAILYNGKIRKTED